MEGDVADKCGIDRGIIGNRSEEKRGGSGYSDMGKGGKSRNTIRTFLSAIEYVDQNIDGIFIEVCRDTYTAFT